MNFIKAVLMGIIQGLTEFVPVSSSGHLTIGRHLLGISDQIGLYLEVALHAGTLAAVCYVFRKDILRMLIESIRMIMDLAYNLKAFFYNRFHEVDERDYRKILHNNYRKLVAMQLISSVPTAAIGYLLMGLEKKACHSLFTAGIAMMVTAVMLLVVDYWQPGSKIPKDITARDAFLIGTCQGVSVISGLSRSGFTITAGLLLGLKKSFAIKYSFLLSVPAVLGALAVQAGDFFAADLTFAQGFDCFAGMIAAGVTGFFCIRFMLRLINKLRFRTFAAYCLFAGTAALILNYFF